MWCYTMVSLETKAEAQLTGSIPSEIGLLTNVFYMDLSEFGSFCNPLGRVPRLVSQTRRFLRACFSNHTMTVGLTIYAQLTTQ
jgi:hypothetical protein